MASDRKKLFILGVGAQKAGTSWLHNQLCSSPSFEPGFTKEYHIFDSLYSPVGQNARNRLLKYSQRAVSAINDGSADPESSNQYIRRLSFIESIDNYFEYFNSLWHTNHQIISTGDITPSYSTLDAEAYALIRQGLVDKGFTPRVIFLMRDPIERIWSMFRMRWRNRQKTISFDAAMRRLLAYHREPGVKLRTRYDRTICELEKAFAPSECYYGFYEELFSESGFRPLKEFVQIEIAEPKFNLSVNASPKEEGQHPDPCMAREIAHTYKSVYEFARDRFGDKIIDLWPNYKHLKDH